MPPGINDVCKQTMNSGKTPGVTAIISYHPELEAGTQQNNSTAFKGIRDQHI